MPRPSLRVPMLTQHLACPTFTQAITPKSSSCLLNCALPLRRAQKFPNAASRRIALSSSASANSRFSRLFSFSRSFSRLAWSIRRPPYCFFFSRVRLLRHTDLLDRLGNGLASPHLDLPPLIAAPRGTDSREIIRAIDAAANLVPAGLLAMPGFVGQNLRPVRRRHTAPGLPCEPHAPQCPVSAIGPRLHHGHGSQAGMTTSGQPCSAASTISRTSLRAMLTVNEAGSNGPSGEKRGQVQFLTPSFGRNCTCPRF